MQDMPKLQKSLQLESNVATYIMGTVPLVGPMLGDLIGKKIRKEYQENLEKWFNDLASELRRVKAQFEDIYDEPEFIETLAAATEAARKTAHREKLEALRNAVLNSIDRDVRPEEDLRLRFINNVDQMVPAHMQILKFYDDPQKHFDAKSSIERPSLSTTSQDLGFIGLQWTEEQRPKYDRLVEDLIAWRLLNTLNRTHGTPDGLINGRQYTTPDGRAFIKYVMFSPVTDN